MYYIVVSPTYTDSYKTTKSIRLTVIRHVSVKLRVIGIHISACGHNLKGTKSSEEILSATQLQSSLENDSQIHSLSLWRSINIHFSLL